MRRLARAVAGLLVLPAMALSASLPAEGAPESTGASPALCAAGDTPEPGVQGDVPAGQTPGYNCGVTLVGSLSRVGNVQGFGACAYVRSREGEVHVIDVSDPASPREVGSVPVRSGSETMRLVASDDRAILVSGSSVYDVKDCLNPQLLGDIQWPPLTLPGIPSRLLPHDIRVNHAGTRVYASFGLWEADISNLEDPGTWEVTDHRCTLAAQQPGPWRELHSQSLAAGLSLCDDSNRPRPRGAEYSIGASPLQSSLLWPTLAHSPEVNGDDTRVYVGDQAGGTGGKWAPTAKVRIIDVTQSPPQIIGEVDGPGHGLDWFRVEGRDYVLHSNEMGTKEHPFTGQPSDSDTCRPYPRPFSLSWAFDAFISDVTRPDQARNVSRLSLAINEPEFCEARKASGVDPWIAYHLVDDPFDATFAAVDFQEAGLRIFDIREPANPREVAYFNHGPLVHGGVGHYDTERGLLYVGGSDGFWVLELAPQVRRYLGLEPGD